LNRIYWREGFGAYEILPDGTERKVEIHLSDAAHRQMLKIIAESPPLPPLPPLFNQPVRPATPPARARNMRDVSAKRLSIPTDYEIAAQVTHPCVVLILGRRDSGKTATAFRIAEHKRSTLPPYVVGPSSLRPLLLKGFGLIESLEDAPRNCLVIIDEAALVYGARDSMKETNKRLGEAINLSRQRSQTLMFLVQEARMIDVTIVSQVDVIIIKELGEISQEFERKELRRYTDAARFTFQPVTCDRRKWAWVFNDKTGFKGLLPVELPTYWSKRLSTGFAAGVRDTVYKDAQPVVRPAQKWTKEETEENVLLLHGGMSMRGIEQVTGVPKSTVQDIVNRSRGRSPRKKKPPE